MFQIAKVNGKILPYHSFSRSGIGFASKLGFYFENSESTNLETESIKGLQEATNELQKLPIGKRYTFEVTILKYILKRGIR